MPRRKVKLIEVEAVDWNMTNGKFDSSYHGNVVTDKTGCFIYGDSNGKQLWGISEEAADLLLGKARVTETREKDEVTLPPLPPVTPLTISLIDIIGAKPKSLNIEFGE